MKLPFELQASETILVLCRRHWVYLYPKLAVLALAGLVPAIVVTVIASAGPGLGSTVGRIVLLADVLWLAFWAVRFYFTLYRYNNDLWVVTNQRIIDSLRRHWFHHQMASADLIDVEDISVRKEGLLPTAFNYGDVRCQTAGEQPNFILANIPDPSGVLGTIDAARDAARRELAQPGWRT
jgi:hypothetical protein